MDLRERNSQLGFRHPWERARSIFFRRILNNVCFGSSTQVLDMGSGDGWFAGELLNDLPSGSSIVCCDPNYTPTDLATELCPRVSRCTDPPVGFFDLVVLLDVIEHIEDDDLFLKTIIASRLRRNGYLLVSVPAYPSLFSNHDTFLGHFRRYEKREFLSLLNKEFRVVTYGSLFVSLAFIRFLQCHVSRSGSNVQQGVGGWRHGALVSGLVTFVLVVDQWICWLASKIRFSIPGLTLWAICTTSETSLD